METKPTHQLPLMEIIGGCVVMLFLVLLNVAYFLGDRINLPQLIYRIGAPPVLAVVVAAATYFLSGRSLEKAARFGLLPIVIMLVISFTQTRGPQRHVEEIDRPHPLEQEQRRQPREGGITG